MIKTSRLCMFSDKCSDCIQQRTCISPTRLIHSKRRFALSLNHKPQYSLETHELFKKGIADHEKHQKNIPTIDEMGYINFRKKLYKHEHITLQELKLCSPTQGFHGIIDLVHFYYDSNQDFHIHIDELKSNFSSKHYIQLTTYAMILANPESRLIYEEPMKRKDKKKRKLGFIFPETIRYLTIKGRIFLMNKEEPQHYNEIMYNNHFFETSGGIKKSIEKKAKEFKELMRQRTVELNTLHQCTSCNMDKCGWSYICLKTPFNEMNESQRYISKTKVELNKLEILNKTKPKRVI